MSAINNAWNGTKDSDNQKYLTQMEAELDRKYQMSKQANMTTATASGLLNAKAFNEPRNDMEVLVRLVENGYTARIDGRVYIAASIEELTGLITVKLLALGGS
jgi:hypothetical protein